MLVTKCCTGCGKLWTHVPVGKVTCPSCHADLKEKGMDNEQQDYSDKVEEIHRMVAGGTTSKDVIARMYGLTPEQLEEILK